MSRSSNSGFHIGQRGQPPGNIRTKPGIRGVSAGQSAVTPRPGASGPGVRGGGPATGGSGGLPGVRRPGSSRGGPSGADKDLAPPVGHVLSDRSVNGVHVRVTGPKAPAPGGQDGIINVEAKERRQVPYQRPEEMARGAASMIAGSPEILDEQQQHATRPSVQQLPKEEPVEAEGSEERPKGAYWSDKYERYVAPGEPEYSVETAQRMGIAV